MSKHTLREAWIYEGQIYGPGEVELDKDVADALKERGAFGDEPTSTEQRRMERLADAIDPEQIEAAEKDAAPARREVAKAEADALRAQADAAQKRAK
jgi:hypothetical protein